MLRRSQSKNQMQLDPSPNDSLDTQATHSQPKPTRAKPSILASYWKDDNNEQRLVLEKIFFLKYNQEAKELQIKPTLSLVRKRDAFLFACTGYGKSRIPELFILLFSKASKPIVLILNPLDTLGDDQVHAKAKFGFSAINLNQVNFSQKAVNDIMAGKYQFVYVSLEIFLNNSVFEEMYFSKEFQDRLVLKVVDEAHLIYAWGLAISGQIKHLKSQTQSQDRTPFRPSYGSLVERFLATDKIPTLLMTATCTPRAFAEILISLKTTLDDIDLHEGELTRPEIRFIRLPLTNSSSWEDLHHFFPTKSDVPDADLPPTLVYCRTQDGTYSALEEINIARDNPNNCHNGLSTCVRRFHAVTARKDKAIHTKDFSKGVFPIMTCTTALGMGQGWTRVRRVVVFGQSDPTEVLQMAGRAGRDGRPAVCFLLVNPASSKNISEICQDPNEVTDDDRMDAMSVTPVCLRVGFAVDLKYGYFPLKVDDPQYLKEKERQHSAGMQPCLCSNCDPEAATGFTKSQLILTNNNFNELVAKKNYDMSALDNLIPLRSKSIQSQTRSVNKLKPVHPDLRQNFCLIRLVSNLQQCTRRCFDEEYPHGSLIDIKYLFSFDQIWLVTVNHQQFLDGRSLDNVFGSEPLPNSYLVILDAIKSWRQSSDSVAILHPTPDEYIMHDQAVLDALELEQARQLANEAKAQKKVVTNDETQNKNDAQHLPAQTSVHSDTTEIRKQKSSGSKTGLNKRRGVDSATKNYLQARGPSGASHGSPGMRANLLEDLETPIDID